MFMMNLLVFLIVIDSDKMYRKLFILIVFICLYIYIYYIWKVFVLYIDFMF